MYMCVFISYKGILVLYAYLSIVYNMLMIKLVRVGGLTRI